MKLSKAQWEELEKAKDQPILGGGHSRSTTRWVLQDKGLLKFDFDLSIEGIGHVSWHITDLGRKVLANRAADL